MLFSQFYKRLFIIGLQGLEDLTDVLRNVDEKSCLSLFDIPSVEEEVGHYIQDLSEDVFVESFAKWLLNAFSHFFNSALPGPSAVLVQLKNVIESVEEIDK